MNRNLPTDDITDLLLFLWRWRKYILGSALGAAFLTLLISSPLITKPNYQAEAVVFAAKNNSSEKQINDPEFGYDVEADRFIQIMLSNSLRDSIISKFNLAENYKIDTASKLGKEKLYRLYNDDISFERTQYMSIAIKVKNESPVLAAKIANTIPLITDHIRASILKKNSMATMLTTKLQYEQKLKEVNALADSIQRIENSNSAALLGKLSEHYTAKKNELENINASLGNLRKKNNLYDYGEEVNILNRQLALAKFNYELEGGKLAVYEHSYSDKDTLVINTKARRQGASEQIKSIEAGLKSLADINQDYLGLTSRRNTEEKILNDVQPGYENQKYAFEPVIKSPLYERLTMAYNENVSLLNGLLEKYERTKQAFEEPVSASYLVSSAEPDLLKKSPSKTLNTIIGFLAGGMMAIVIILFAQRFSLIKSRIQKEEAAGKLLNNISGAANKLKSEESVSVK